uniref:Glucosidase II subunit alpha n=1 Tax=Corethrella appendiculata TaxID=1370023 RepID=U5EKN8_9DIPT
MMVKFRLSIFLLIFFLSFHQIQSVDHNNFKTCEQSSFCRRLRKTSPAGDSHFELKPNTLNTFKNHVTIELENTENQHLFVLKLEAVKGNVFHIEVDEKTPLKTRYRVVDALKGPLALEAIKVDEKTADKVVISSGGNKVVLYAKPFKADFYNGEKILVTANAKGLMEFEELRTKPEPQQASEDNPDGEAQQDVAQPSIDPGAWEENFKSHHDSKPNGPEALSLDFTFPYADVLFGIPEHADSFILKHTVGGNSDPYRLYNLDVFEYELDSRMALYGAVPVVYGHGSEYTAGVYWQNAAETWVDIFNPNLETNVVSSIVNFVAGSRKTEPPTANFISESGIMDAFILLGPTPIDSFKQFTDLTGVGPLPQMFAIAYHQCRWNYNDEQDVAQVHAKFDEHDIPMDTMWLDIEYTDAKKYFTWDSHKFPHPLEMIANLTAKGRHLTIIIDPHIKRDGGYFFHNDCTDRGYYTKNKDGNDYEGWCWPGAASYPDLFNPEVRKYFADQYLVENFKESTVDLGLWNDMNEPSVFNGPEVTMLKDNLHFGGWEHRDIHNLYGHMHIMSSFDGLTRRAAGKLRPFILTRSHFAGSQRFAAVWTGDNTADWGHLRASIKMCLSLSVAGISFCGADVGGFFGNPDAELFSRWYQTAAFQPFFRSHAHIDTKRREPWLFPEDTKQVIRNAIRKRYSYLPFWYTLFYEHERSGHPIMRPLLAHYPTDKEAFTLDNEYLLGDELLVRPVLDEKANKVDVYFPAKADKDYDFWYDIDDYRRIEKHGYETITVDANKIPVYQRGGTIVPKKERIRRASTLMHSDPFTLIVCLNKLNRAKGTLYIDDELGYEYRNGKYLYLDFEFKDDVLSVHKIDESASYPTKTWLERVVIAGLAKQPKSATLHLSSGKSSPLEVYKDGNTFVVRKPGISMLEKWSIKLNY